MPQTPVNQARNIRNGSNAARHHPPAGAARRSTNADFSRLNQRREKDGLEKTSFQKRNPRRERLRQWRERRAFAARQQLRVASGDYQDLPMSAPKRLATM